MLKLVLGVFVIVSSVAGDQLQCNDCMADKLMNAMNEYDAVRTCWFYTHKDFLLKEKIYTLEALIDALNYALNVNNKLVEDKCKSSTQLKSCTMDDKYAMSECLMASLRVLVEAYKTQEQCNGTAVKTEEMEVVARLMLGNIVGWRSFHPDC